MNNKVYKYIIKNNILQNGESVVLGVSGGADSICMLYVLGELKEKLGIKLYVVHVNHMIRGKDAKEDAAFVENTCKSMNIPFYLEEVDVPKLAEQKGMSEEEAGRESRYAIFEKYRKQLNADKIAVAHQLNDQSETILFHLFRGSGIKGLLGIPAKRGVIIRPLLCVTRDEIEQYLKNNQIQYHTDYTNNLTEYSRNKIRLELIPYIKENINEKAEYNIVSAAEHLSDIYDYISIETGKAYEKYVLNNELSEDAFLLHPIILSGVIRKMIENQAGKLKDITKTHIESVMELTSRQVSKRVDLPYQLSAVRTYDGIAIEKKSKDEKLQVEEIVLSDGVICENPFVKITEETGTFDRTNIPNLMYTKWLDYDKIKRLYIRNRRPKDFLQIDDFGGKKTLKDYLINEKIPKEDREQILLLAEESHIVWIIGHRISSYYKVTESTKRIIRVEYLKQKKEIYESKGSER